MSTPLRARLATALRLIDAGAERAATIGLSWLLWLVLYAMTAGSGLWMITHRAQLGVVASNKLGIPGALSMLMWVGGALLALLLLHAGVAFQARRKNIPSPLLTAAGVLTPRLRFLLALPLVPALAFPKLETEKPELTYFYAGLAAAIIGWTVYGWTRPAATEPTGELAPEPPPRPETAARVAAGVAVSALWAAYGLFFSRLSITNHHALNSRVIDLGYYDNIFYQSIHGRPLGCSLIRGGWHGSAHFDPLLVLLSPLYLIYPRAELILVLQAVWVGSAVIPVYLLTREKLGRRLPAVILAVMFALYPALHGANMYEFHSLTLLSPLLLWVLYFLERGSFRAYFLMLIPTLLLREDVPLLLCFVGLYAIISRRPGYARVGWVTILVSLIYFVIAKVVLMPSPGIFMSGKEALSFAYYYEDLIPNKDGVKGLIVSVLTNPAYVLKHVFTEPKIRYFLTLFLPLAFLPFFARTSRVMLGYGMLFCFLATRTAVFSPAFQYSSVIFPVAFALVPTALRQIEDGRLPGALGLDGGRLSRSLLGAAFAASLLVSWKFGGILENEAFRGGFGRVTRRLSQEQQEVYAWVREAVERIPRGVSVGVTNRTGAHASNRKDVFFYPGQAVNQQWLLLDENELKDAERTKHQERVTRGEYALVSRYKNTKLALYERRKPASAPAAPAPPAPPAATPPAPGSAAPAAPPPPTPPASAAPRAPGDSPGEGAVPEEPPGQ